MKYAKRNILAFLVLMLGLACTMSGCAENHYYNTYHHHTREWYDRHHTPPPAGVNFDVEVR